MATSIKSRIDQEFSQYSQIDEDLVNIKVGTLMSVTKPISFFTNGAQVFQPGEVCLVLSPSAMRKNPEGEEKMANYKKIGLGLGLVYIYVFSLKYSELGYLCWNYDNGCPLVPFK